ncbi:MAG: fasciclin domain-containing protein [Nitriliruptor sp.]|uniref:fasciclin domain-containing protein n=1 Tax=Nitriliruptor sp. TaxID=2448056 RepID=UPI0034A0918B
MRSTRRSLRITAAAASAALLLAACGGDDTDADTTSADTETETTEEMGDDEMGGDEMAADLTATNLGEACAAIPADGAGSAEGMAQDPVATAASNNPLLSTLVSLVDQAGLVDTLNGLEAATVFAPTNDAFDALQESDPELFDTVANDPDLLATVLTYHVVGGEELNAQDLLDAGSATTVAEQDVTVVEGGVEGIQVEAAGGNTADVICGNVETANATVHLIDAVLLPDVG